LLTGGGIQSAANTVQQTQEGFQDQRSAFFGQHPGIAIGSDLYGTAFNPLNKVLGPLTEGLGPVAKGAVYGVTIGGTRGLGEGTGTVAQRLPSAATGAAIGLIAGSVLGQAVKVVGPTLGKLFQNARRILGADAAPAEISNAVEASIRTRLAKMKVSPEDIERAVQTWRTTGELSVRRIAENFPPQPAQPVSVRPGETVTPVDQTPILPTLRANADPMETVPAYVRGGNPRGLPNFTAPTPADVMPHDPGAAARTAYHLANMAGINPTEAAARAAGTYSNYDPRQALLLALLLGKKTVP
jgi:hypothetical protein